MGPVLYSICSFKALFAVYKSIIIRKNVEYSEEGNAEWAQILRQKGKESFGILTESSILHSEIQPVLQTH